MPQALANTYRRRLHAAARDTYGYVTPSIAGEVGVPAVELRKLAARGGLTHITRGVYRFDDIDTGERGPYLEAVLAVGPDAYLTGDAVLAFLDLALVNPRKIRIGTHRRVRRRLPEHIEVVQDRLPNDDRTVYQGVPSATVARAIIDSVGKVMPERLADALEVARTEGYIRRDELQRVLEAISAPP